jgi:hypothetical protein
MTARLSFTRRTARSKGRVPGDRGVLMDISRYEILSEAKGRPIIS